MFCNGYLSPNLCYKMFEMLKGLICSLLHLTPEEVDSVEITNPIELGTSVTDKTFILDIKLNLNDSTVINLELQVINQHNWIGRSLSYLCRSFDSLQAGEKYSAAKSVIQIGLLNFCLFPKQPEFYATYQLLNVKNHTLYSDRLRLSVLDLTCIDLATEEDRFHQLDCWARFFKATTWEELNMLAHDNEIFKEAAATVHQLTKEERIRMECEAREDFYRTQRGIQDMLDERAAKIDTLTTEIESLTSKNETLASENESLASKLAKLEAWAMEKGYHPVEIP